MKKNLLTIFTLLCVSVFMNGQAFLDDFDSYTAGDYLAASNSDWTTWGGTTGTAEDVRISDEAAFSGANSIKFASTASGGGPQDVVKYFTGSKITSGVLNTNMALLVETSAYFNYQGEVAIGTTWSMNAFFEADGKGRITGSSNADILSFDYPVGEWFEWNMVINFDANKWQLEVNGVCVGSFSNPDNSIASMDIYPVQGNSFFIDDFGYEYSEVAPTIMRDAIVAIEASQPSALAGATTDVRGLFLNGGQETITSITAEISLDGEVTPLVLDGLDLTTGASVPFTVVEGYEIPAGTSKAIVTITEINGGGFDDEDLCNDAFTIDLFGLVPADGKKIIIEEATGTWCGWCPRGAVALERFTHRYPDTYIGIAVHNNDPMDIGDYDASLAVGGYPSALVNRVLEIDPGQTEGPFVELVIEPSIASIITGAEWNEDTRELKMSLSVTALDMITTDHKVNVVMTEDGIQNDASGYAQANYYSGSQDLIDIHGVNYRDLADPIPASDIVHDHVARAMLAPFDGLENSFAEDLSSGDQYVLNFTYTVPADFNVDNMNIVSMLINPDGTINTGEADSVAEAIENGWEEGVIVSADDESLNAGVNVFPNPMSDYTNVRINLSQKSDVALELIDMTGKSIMAKTYKNQNGLFSTIVNTQSVSAGNYVLRIRAGESFTTRKLTIVK